MDDICKNTADVWELCWVDQENVVWYAFWFNFEIIYYFKYGYLYDRKYLLSKWKAHSSCLAQLSQSASGKNVAEQ